MLRGEMRRLARLERLVRVILRVLELEERQILEILAELEPKVKTYKRSVSLKITQA